jgi:hypothetical protein
MTQAKGPHIVFSILLLSAFCSSAVIAAEIKGIPLGDSICDDLNPRKEEDVIKKFSNILTRKADKLFVKLNNGKTISRTDIPCKETDADLCKWNTFWNYRAYDYFNDSGFLLIEKQSYEYSEYELISIRDGSSLVIQGLPTFSPDKKRFIVNVNSIYDNFVSRLEIWRIESDKFIKEFNYEPKEWPSVHTKWASNGKEIIIREARCIQDESGHEKGYALEIIARLQRIDSRWKVVK